ncbi:MAG: HD domain-containing protein [Clostridia bacterium]|nr:HD domain-containing protein [Clostridia bacterium]
MDGIAWYAAKTTARYLEAHFMFTEGEFSVFDIAFSISDVIDLVSSDLSSHHRKVAYISYNIAKEMDLPDDEIKDIVLAAILHDIGAVTDKERMHLKEAMFDDSALTEHALMGYKLLQDFEPFSNAATIIKYHHTHLGELKYEIPIGSYIVHLADRVSILLDEHKEILAQIPAIMREIDNNRSIFQPDTLAALHRFAKYEYFWIEACSPPFNYVLPERMRFARERMDLEALRRFAKVVAHIIDFRSRFTSTHSSGVAAVALELTIISGFSERECKMMEIAGFLHDLGKLAIPNEILEKNSALTHEEFNEMRKHTYYTYIVLKRIKGLEHISTWAAYHHEKLDGTGYPFHVKGEDFSKLARIMAVADIVTAITEDRPYRLGMSSEEAIKVLTNMVKSGAIDQGIVELVKENFSCINDVRIKAQQDAQHEYIAFRN